MNIYEFLENITDEDAFKKHFVSEDM